LNDTQRRAMFAKHHLPSKQLRRKYWKGGYVHTNVGKHGMCENCGSNSFGKKIYKTHYNDRIKGIYCSNCGSGKPNGVLI